MQSHLPLVKPRDLSREFFLVAVRLGNVLMELVDTLVDRVYFVRQCRDLLVLFGKLAAACLYLALDTLYFLADSTIVLVKLAHCLLIAAAVLKQRPAVILNILYLLLFQVNVVQRVQSVVVELEYLFGYLSDLVLRVGALSALLLVLLFKLVYLFRQHCRLLFGGGDYVGLLLYLIIETLQGQTRAFALIFKLLDKARQSGYLRACADILLLELAYPVRHSLGLNCEFRDLGSVTLEFLVLSLDALAELGYLAVKRVKLLFTRDNAAPVYARAASKRTARIDELTVQCDDTKSVTVLLADNGRCVDIVHHRRQSKQIADYLRVLVAALHKLARDALKACLVLKSRLVEVSALHRGERIERCTTRVRFL